MDIRGIKIDTRTYDFDAKITKVDADGYINITGLQVNDDGYITI